MLTFYDVSGSVTSVALAPSPDKEKYDKNLMKFLAPKLSSVEACKTKKFRAKLKSYAEVLEIDVYESSHNYKVKKNQPKSKKISREKDLNEEIKLLKVQISQITNLIEWVCLILIKDAEDENKVLELLKQIVMPVVNNKDKDQSIVPMVIDNTEIPQDKASTKRKTTENNTNLLTKDHAKIRKTLPGKTWPHATAEQESSGIYRSAVLFDRNNQEEQQNQQSPNHEQ